MKKISVIIRSRNDVEYIDKTLKAVLLCDYNNIEIISLDNNSTDGTREILESYPQVKKFQIPEGKYTHGSALNFGFSKASGDIIVFNNADAIPQNENWLQNLIKPLEDTSISASYARQIPRKDAFPWIVRDTLVGFPEGKPIIENFFSMASSASRRDILEKFPFDNFAKFSEDLIWTNELLNSGYKLAYANNAIVEHSHNYSDESAKSRFYGEASAYTKVFQKSQTLFSLMKGLCGGLFRDTYYCIRNRCLKNLFGFYKYRFIQKIYFYKGMKDTLKNSKKKKKIAIVLNRFYPEVGGAEINLFYQSTELAKKYDVTVFTPKRLIDEKDYEEINNFKVFRLKDFFNPLNKFPNLKRDTFIPSVLWRLFFGKFDIIQVFPSLNYNNILAFFVAKILRKPFIFCSFDLLDYASIIEKTGSVGNECIDKCIPSKFKQFLFAKCSHIFAISNREINFFKRYNKNVSFSPVPVKIDEYSNTPISDVRKKFNIPSDAMLFFCLGRVSKIKGQDLAVEAFCKVAHEIPNAYLAIAGRYDYEPDFYQSMQNTIKKYSMEDRILFLGMLERDDVINLLKQGDIHIVPVRFMNSGAVIVETWAAKTPVIQSDSVDPNLLEDGINGFIFKSENVKELGDAILSACKNKEFLKDMGNAGYDKVIKGFTYESLIKIYDEIYEKLLHGE